ncbi:MAG: TIGR04150 pseudo-rSAM protein [Candidatus Aminicenantes bacterium]|nr:TIGR04150 pseudo-rSAM protein [Candidatus Aminicenantes bacterium]
MNNDTPKPLYWFYLDNYVHLERLEDRVLLYNSLTGEIREYADNPAVLQLVEKLQAPENLLVVPLGEKELEDPQISAFVREMRSLFMGDLIETSRSSGKPVQMMPMLKLHRDIDKMKTESFRSVGVDVMKYLDNMALYVNGNCTLDCNICASAHKQFLWCNREKSGTQLPIDQIRQLFEQLVGSDLCHVHILGGNILTYPGLRELISILAEHRLKRTLYIHYSNLADGRDSLQDLGLIPDSNCQIKIPVTFPVDETKLEKASHILEDCSMPGTFAFALQSEAEFAEAECLISAFSIDPVSFHPFFNGQNLEFFEQAVFVDRQNLSNARPSMKDIHSRQVMNPFLFGNLTVLSNGDIHAGVNDPSLGNLSKDSIYDIVYREVFEGKTWRRTRKEVVPCRDCVFAALCPPLSHYEYALGKNNLCRIVGSVKADEKGEEIHYKS